MRDAQISRVALTVVFFLGLTLVTAGCTQPDQSYSSGALQAGAQIPSFAPVVRSVIPAVVNVSAVQKAGSPLAGEAGTASRANYQSTVRGLSPPAMDELLRKFFDNLEAGPSPNIPSRSIGSGFTVDRAGYIVTEDHVIENADKITVTFQDGTKHIAHIIGRDPKTDLALLKIDTDRPLPFVDWGDSDTARVGDWVMAIGNPFGLDATVSSGIISGRGRDMHLGPYDDFLQIDAAINLGNSGGPTFDLSGRVIGINTAIYSPNGGSVGIGFAVPSKLAQPVIEQLKTHGTVERGWLGVRIQDLTPEIARAFGLPKPEGGLVADVTQGSPAAQAGFAQGDVSLPG